MVDLIPAEEATDASHSSSEHKEFLDAQSVLLRLFLCHVYHLRLQKRSKPPPPLSENPRKPPPTNIIRSFMAITQHQIACQPLGQYLTGLCDVVSKSGLPFTCVGFKVPGLQGILGALTRDIESINAKSTIHRLLAGLTTSQVTTATMTLTETRGDASSIEHTVVVKARTDLSAPTFGTEFSVEMPQAIAKLRYGQDSHDRKVLFAALPELKEYLSHLLSMQVIHQVLLPRSTGWSATNDLPVLNKIIGTNGSQQAVAIGVRIDDAQVELRRRRLGVEGGQDCTIWSKTSDGGKPLTDIFTTWAAES